jgi:hypothetical protein
MIVSHRHRFVFVKTRKTAGTSVELALSQACGPEDIVTPVSPEDEPLRAEGDPGPRNYYMGPWWRQRPRELLRSLVGGGRRPCLYNHVPAARARRLLGREVWDGYYRFCFERNPWDKVVSAYYWRNRDQLGPDGEPPLSFASFVAQGPKAWRVSDLHLYTLRGELLVDRVCRFEQLEQELGSVCEQLGVSWDGRLPSAKATTRRRAPGKAKRDYTSYYSDAEVAAVGRCFRREIELMGYRFGE